MRVISGALGGRKFDAPKGHRTHPMSDRMRGAVFSVLGDIEGLTVLDCFSGSGALAIEAASRGAESVIAIESDKNAHDTITKNLSNLSLEKQIKAVRSTCSGWSMNNQDATFDIVMADPPYDHLQLQAINRLAKHLAPNGTFVLSWPGSVGQPGLDSLKIVTSKSHGDAQVIFYQAKD